MATLSVVRDEAELGDAVAIASTCNCPLSLLLDDRNDVLFAGLGSVPGTLVVIAPLSALQNATVMGDLMGGWPFEPALPIALAMAADAEVDVHGETTSSYVIGCGSVTKIVLVPLPDTASRSYSPTHSLAVTGGLLKAGLSETAGTAVVLAALASADHAGATACGVARALPLYSRKQTSSTKCLAACAVAFSTVVAPLELLAPSIGVSAAVAAVRNAARLTDTPCAELNAEQFEDAIRSRLADLPGVTIYSIVGVSELREHGLGGIAAVGQAALCPPRLVVMMLTPSDSEAALAPPIGLVGKGIVFDTGGLNLKANGGRGMKDDCAGAAAALGAFELLARLAEAGDPAAIQAPVVAALCIAENALGAASYRPDDIVQMHSGKTVEVVDTDSEGRFVIGDGCSWLARRHGCRILVDAATLTGHSAFTGRVHAAILSNDTAMEMVGLTSSFATGELVHPMIFAPEQAKNMLHSTIADMTNDPSDGEGYMYSAMSGYFVYAQVEDIPDVRWLHIDFGDPEMHFFGQTWMSSSGYGVQLMASVAQKAALLNAAVGWEEVASSAAGRLGRL